MRKRVGWGLAISGVFLAGLLAGMIFSGALPVFASNSSANNARANTKGDYCQLYEQTLLKNLPGVSQSQLEQANAAAIQAVIDQMAKDGKITDAQKSALEQKAAQLKSHPCAHLGALVGHGAGKHGAGGPAGNLGADLKGARQAIVASVASAIGISPDTLNTDLANGQTLSQIAGAKLSAAHDAYLSAVKAQLAQAVSSGKITQAQSDMASNAIQQAVSNGHYPLLERGGPMGGHMGTPNQPASSAPAQ